MSYTTPTTLAQGATVKAASDWNVLVNNLINLNTRLIDLEKEAPGEPDFSSFPIGVVVPYTKPAATLPEGWYVCDGGTYEGVTVPDMREKTVLGIASDEGDGNLLETGGSKTHDHQNPNTASSGSHSHSASGTTGAATTRINVPTGTGTLVAAPEHNHTLNFTTGSGGGHSHSVGDTESANNMPPNLKAYWVIRLS